MSSVLVGDHTNENIIKHTPNNRLPMIDIAKGIGILLIVLGHNGMFNIYLPFMADLLASFRIPFFFFISGVIFSLGDKSIRRVAIERADAWLKPCLVVVTTLGILYVLAGKRDIESVFVGMVYASGFTFFWPPLWFLPHLWLAYITTTALLIWGKGLFSVPWRRAVSLLSLVIGGYYVVQAFNSPADEAICEKQNEFSLNLFDCGLPYSADLLMITVFFFLMGHFLSSRTRAFKPNIVLGAIALGLLITLNFVIPGRLDLNHRVYQNILLTPVQSFCGIYVMLSLCTYMALSAPVARLFAYLGRVSLFILIFHSPLVFLITRQMPRLVDSPLLVGVGAFVVPVLLSVVAYYLCKSNRWTRLLMFPLKHNRRLVAQP